jgi:Holliday junction resolvase RusA-like endonuclease
MEISFFVPGIPQPGGSKKAFFNKKTGRAIVVEDAKHNKEWRAVVAYAAGLIADREYLFNEPLRLRMDFVFPRPKGHYGSGKNAGVLKPSAPPFPAVRPDATKVLRSTEDALKGILWRDDCQIVTQTVTKRYGDIAGCKIYVVEEKA